MRPSCASLNGIVTSTRVTPRPSSRPPAPRASRPVGPHLEDLPLDLPAELREALDVVGRDLALRRRERGTQVRPRIEPEVRDMVQLVPRRALRDRDAPDARPLLDRGQVRAPAVGIEGAWIGRLAD